MRKYQKNTGLSFKISKRQSGPLATLEVELDPYFISMYDMTVCVVRGGMGRDIL